MRNLFCCFVLLTLCASNSLYASFLGIEPHAHRTPRASKLLPASKEARALLAALTKKNSGTVLLNTEELIKLGVTSTTTLPCMTIEEVQLEGSGAVYTIFLLPGEQGFGATLISGDRLQLFRFDSELKLIAGWARETDGTYTPLSLSAALRGSRECLQQWKYLHTQ